MFTDTFIKPTDHTEIEDDQPSPPELLETQGFVKPIPDFTTQLEEVDRTNEITFVTGVRTAIEKSTDGLPTSVATEHDALRQLDAFLEDVKARGTEDHRRKAISMQENLSFIGQKEYSEAFVTFADHWRSLLDKNEDTQICAVVGRISEGNVKSDSYLLDNILGQFSDEELSKYKGRIVTDPRGLTCEPQDARIFLLDDWPISGSQLRTAAQSLSEDFPQFRNSLEVLAVAATPEKIDEGLSLLPVNGSEMADGSITIPIRSYFVARPVSREIAPKSGAHITSYYSSVDYGFNRDIADMAVDIDRDMPAGITNIVRPYRNGTPLTHAARLGEGSYAPLEPKYISAGDDEIM